MRCGDFSTDLTALRQFIHQGRPFLAEHLGTGQGAVTTDDNQAIDSLLDHVGGSLAAAIARAEFLTARGSNDGASAMQDTSHRIPVHFLNAFTTFHETLIALVDGVDFRTLVQRSANHGPDGCVHTLGITAAGENCNSFGCHNPVSRIIKIRNELYRGLSGTLVSDGQPHPWA